MSFIPAPVWRAPSSPIIGNSITLVPLTADLVDAVTIAGEDDRIWSFFPLDLSDRFKHARYLYQMLDKADAGLCIPFAIQDNFTGKIIGMTRLFNLCEENRQCEIGSWLHPSCWATGINKESKFLLLEFCFEGLQAIRVQFRTDSRNIRSKKALEKIGAVHEGMLRCEKILEDGTTRDAFIFSILKGEWPEVRLRLTAHHTLTTFTEAISAPGGIPLMHLSPLTFAQQ